MQDRDRAWCLGLVGKALQQRSGGGKGTRTAAQDSDARRRDAGQALRHGGQSPQAENLIRLNHLSRIGRDKRFARDVFSRQTFGRLMTSSRKNQGVGAKLDDKIRPRDA